MSFIEHYPLVLKLLGESRFLHLKDRTRFRTLISKETTEDAEDYDATYTRDLQRNTCLLQIIKCDGCTNYVKYRWARHTECEECCKLLCYNCAVKVYAGNCPGCDE
jgi:hypothetical protein